MAFRSRQLIKRRRVVDVPAGAREVCYELGSLGACCFVDRRNSILDPPLDLGALLVEDGLAVATAEAPRRYATLERIARARERGVWGFQVDAIR